MKSEKRPRVHDDFLKQEIIITGNIENGGGIAIGWDTSEMVQQVVLPVQAKSVELQLFSFEDLTDRVENSDLPPTRKERTRTNLQTLQSEMERGKAGNLKTTRVMLQEISETMPNLREPLWYWLTETIHVPSPVKIVARNVLQAQTDG